MTDPLGQSQVLPYLQELSLAGYRFTLISCEKKERYRKNKAIIENICEKFNIDWHPISYTKYPPVISTLWDIRQLKIKAFSLNKKKAFKIVHCRSYIASLVGLEMKRKLEVKFIFDMRGFWADERVDGQLWSLKNPIQKRAYNFFKKFEKEAILEADATICLTQNGIAEMKNWEYITSDITKKIHHITTCCNILNYQETFNIRSTREFNKEAFKLVYIGSIGPWHSFDRLSKLVKVAYFDYPHCTFKLIISSGRELFEQFILDNQMDRNRFVIKFVPHKDIPTELIDTDIGFFFIPIQYSKKASSPTKMGEMLSAGLPIITGPMCGDVDKLVEENNIGVILYEYNMEHIKAALKKIVEESALNKNKLMKRCLATAEDYFSIEKGINSYLRIYKELIHG